MSTNTEKVKQVWEHYGNGDVYEVLEMVSDDVVFAFPSTYNREASATTEYKGRNGVLAMLGDIANSNVERGVPTGERVYEQGNDVIVFATSKASRKDNGEATDIAVVQLWRFNSEGKLSEVRDYVDALAWAKAYV